MAIPLRTLGQRASEERYLKTVLVTLTVDYDWEPIRNWAATKYIYKIRNSPYQSLIRKQGLKSFIQISGVLLGRRG